MFSELYKIRPIRVIIVKLRAFLLIRVFKRLKTLESKDAFGVTISHNLMGLYPCNDRVNLLVNPLVSIEKITPDSKVLVIGPRNENELFLLASHGIKIDNITGLDLISYTDRIKVGDVHNMEFADDSFDAVIFGWALSYSSEPQKAIDEVVRVTKNGGIVAVGVEYAELDQKDAEKLLGYSIQEYDKLQDRVNSTEQLLSLFGDRHDHVYFNHDAPLKLAHSGDGRAPKVSNVAVAVQIAK